VLVTTLVDNVYDALLPGDDRVRRLPFTAGTAAAPQFAGRTTTVGLIAEHGFAALVRVRRGDATTTLLFGTGPPLPPPCPRLDPRQQRNDLLAHGCLSPRRQDAQRGSSPPNSSGVGLGPQQELGQTSSRTAALAGRLPEWSETVRMGDGYCP
jgi:hypothetical protein